MRWDAVCGQLASHEYGVTSRGGLKKVKVHFSQILSEYETYIPPFLKTVFLHSLKLSSNWTEYEMDAVCDGYQPREQKVICGNCFLERQIGSKQRDPGLGHLT